ncbi:MAG: HAD-IA family hydrolase [Candidatus Nanoarchaeia archaeon]|nr:HAD-IA family hydrolase [Candidatus Nanoarchaeia archaeon]MDD5054237.1 HAD-IA family hydrolase [Candidatus Nanoarchaeia archaeon]MDD5499940.1 HAD-IA family hydrolase [Candidatus Nanoarchaeia archaeon]
MLLILDLDGTIIDSEEAHFNSFVKAINRHGFPLNLSQKKQIKSEFGKSGKEIIRGVLIKALDEEIDAISKDVKKISVSEEFHNVKFINGAKEFIIDNYKKHDLALATNSSKIFTDKAVKELKLAKFFKKIVTANDVKKAKPHPDMLELIIKELKYSKKDSIFIGDSVFDYLSAKKAGIRFMAVLAKSDYKKELKKVAECYNDLSEVKI